MHEQRNIPLLSVVLGIFNNESTLSEALESLLNQSFQDFELIICDDGSTDKSYDILLTFKQQYPNIVLLKNEINQGLNYTLNKCLAQAKGQFVARMDGDDISLPNRFEKQTKFLLTNPEFDIVSSSMIYFDEKGDYKQGKVIEYPQKRDFIHGTPFCHAPAMVRKTAYDAVKGYSVSERLIRVEDYHLWFKMYTIGLKGYNINEALYKMRDDRRAYKRRKFKYRINEMYVKHIGYKMFGLPIYYQVFALKPLLVGLLPHFIYKFLHKL